MSDRHIKVVNVIKGLAATFIQHEANTDPLITVTDANASPDFKNVTIFVTTLPDGKEEDALIFLKRVGSQMRGYIKERTRLKVIPHIDFAIDYGERHRQHIDEIVRDIDGKKDDNNPSV
jgi:ribosome-binding factor A